MKKSLLFAMAAAMFGGIQSTAENAVPTSFDDLWFTIMSPNGRYAGSEFDGVVTILDTKSGTLTSFGTDDGGFYSLGMGNCLNNSGLLLGSQTESYDASYYENGEWKSLPVPNSVGMADLANGVTPDGSRICGTLAIKALDVDASMMTVPVIWNRQADGTYGEYFVLPHPDKDFTGREPQQISANWISDDGKTIAGQVTDYGGAVQEIIIYRQDADGNWSYELPFFDLYNPEKLEFPEYPGEGPESPVEEDFMSEGEKANYQDAIQEWIDGGYQGSYPDYSDYMDDEEKAAYEAAREKYEKELEEWSEKYNAFDDVYYACLDVAPLMVFNSEILSTDGKLYVVACQVENPNSTSWFDATMEETWKFDLESNEITKYTNVEGVSATTICSGGILVGSTSIWDNPQGYITENGEWKPIVEYIEKRKPEWTEWIGENMLHNVVVGMDEEWNDIYDDVLLTGMPVASADLSVILTSAQNVWDFMTYTKAYLFDFGQADAAVKTIAADGNIVIKAEGKTIVVEGDVASIEVFDVNGRQVLNVDAPASVVPTNLASGIYVVRAVAPNGAVTTAKVAL